MKRYAAVRIEEHREDPPYFRAVLEDDNLAVDAGSPEEAIEGLISELENREVMRIKMGEKALVETPIKDGDRVLVLTDFERAYKIRFGNAVRRNVALPSWMDDEIRTRGLDASKIFQSAIAEALKGEG